VQNFLEVEGEPKREDREADEAEAHYC
jgi:hypothetical protein